MRPFFAENMLAWLHRELNEAAGDDTQLRLAWLATFDEAVGRLFEEEDYDEYAPEVEHD